MKNVSAAAVIERIESTLRVTAPKSRPAARPLNPASGGHPPPLRGAADFWLAGREPGFHVAVIAAFGVGDGKQKSLGAVEKAQAQHVGAQK